MDKEHVIQVTTEKDSSAYPWKPNCRILDETADPSCNVSMRMDALARKFHETHDLKVKEEIEGLAREYGELNKPWRFVLK